MSELKAKAIAEFVKRFHEAPAVIARAPGRVNLIGEHTDYNDGFVLPMAIDRAVMIALRPRADDRVIAYSPDFPQLVAFNLGQETPAPGFWGEYVKGTAWALAEAGLTLTGWEGVIVSDVPMGAGLSSSAALELATARAFASVSGFAWDPAAMAKVGQHAENDWVGVKCGIMDQMTSAAGVDGHAVLIDCRSLEVTPVPLPSGTSVVILDSDTRRELVESAYNERRRQCEAAADFFRVPKLRDVSIADFRAREADLMAIDDGTGVGNVGRRARHIVTDSARTEAAAGAMRSGDAQEMGRLMNASHISMRDDFAISRREIDVLVEIAQAHPACYGARLTGGGFGGCAVALVRTDAAQAFADATAAEYVRRIEAEMGKTLEPRLYVTTGKAGASLG